VFEADDHWGGGTGENRSEGQETGDEWCGKRTEEQGGIKSVSPIRRKLS